jgi:hypothetical protein
MDSTRIEVAPHSGLFSQQLERAVSDEITEAAEPSNFRQETALREQRFVSLPPARDGSCLAESKTRIAYILRNH